MGRAAQSKAEAGVAVASKDGSHPSTQSGEAHAIRRQPERRMRCVQTDRENKWQKKIQLTPHN